MPTLVLMKKCAMKIEIKIKTMGASYKLIREKWVQKTVTERRKIEHFFIGDINSIGTNNVLEERRE